MSAINHDASVVILAGGRGERLRPLTDVLPKVLLPLGDGTVLDYLLEEAADVGINDVHIMLGRHAALVQAYLQVREAQHQRLTLTLHRGTGELGTAGPLRSVTGQPGPWLVVNGDIATDVSLLDVLHAHCESGADVTAVGVEHVVPIPFGVFCLDEAGRILAVTEKPVIRSVVNAGINVLGPDARKRLSHSGPADMTELIARCITDGLTVRIYQTQSEWFDVGTADDYAGALQAWAKRSPREGADKDV